jgi:PPK2 family polyphosphate:nucleotide phosphotransferase
MPAGDAGLIVSGALSGVRVSLPLGDTVPDPLCWTGAGASGQEALMNYGKKFVVKHGSKVRLGKIDPSYAGKHASRETAVAETAKQVERIDRLQYLIYAGASRSLLIVLQGLDAAGKDGVVRHLFTGVNPQGTKVFAFKEPTREELAHDFLWRVHRCTPGKGEVAIFNRSHYEDVLVVRVHKLAPRSVWSRRYDVINDFETMLVENGTQILKFYLHISEDEQLERFRQRLEDPARRWKISESDYTERELWPKYIEAYEDAIALTSTKQAPWYVIPSNHKWFRNLAISQIVADTMDDMGLKVPPPRVDLSAIWKKYHAAKRAADSGHSAR